MTQRSADPPCAVPCGSPKREGGGRRSPWTSAPTSDLSRATQSLAKEKENGVNLKTDKKILNVTVKVHPDSKQNKTLSVQTEHCIHYL